MGSPAFYGSSGHTHNSYLWALTAGGIGVFGLYLLLFYLTYRMLRQLERSGPQELLWLSKGLRVSLVLFMIFSAFADFWLSDFMYLDPWINDLYDLSLAASGASSSNLAESLDGVRFDRPVGCRSLWDNTFLRSSRLRTMTVNWPVDASADRDD